MKRNASEGEVTALYVAEPGLELELELAWPGCVGGDSWRLAGVWLAFGRQPTRMPDGSLPLEIKST